MKPIALVTGANRGIGLALSKLLIDQDYRVLLGCRDLKKAEVTREKLSSENAFSVQVDLLQPEKFSALRSDIESRFGQLDVLVNNAGINYDTWQDAADPDFEQVKNTWQVNTLGPWQLAVALLPIIPRGGRIVNVSSESGSLNGMGGGTPAYSITKAALNAMTIKLAHAVRSKGILVNAVCPGWVRTDMGGAAAPRSPEQGAKSVYWAIDLPDTGPTAGFFRDGQMLSW